MARQKKVENKYILTTFMDTNVIFLNLWSYMDTWNIKEYSKTTMCEIGPPLWIVGLKIMSSTLAYNVI